MSDKNNDKSENESDDGEDKNSSPLAFKNKMNFFKGRNTILDINNDLIKQGFIDNI